jgi:UDPglucose 6-dehydrogenase
MNIGIIGRGFVGGSLEKYISQRANFITNKKINISCYDVSDSDDINIGYERVVRQSDFIYLCVPTPMNKDGSCNTEIVEQSLHLIDFWCAVHAKKVIVIIKSTMVVGTTSNLEEKVRNIQLVVSPEFLTERTAFDDVKNTDYNLYGVFNAETEAKVYQLNNTIWPYAQAVFVSPEEAELIKYMTNSYYALKVTFANMMNQLAENLGIDYAEFIETAVEVDGRLGSAEGDKLLHWHVPGPDGNLGFGGKCFSKDMNGMIRLLEANGINAGVLKKAWEYNLEVREDQDWNRIKGATVENMHL